MANKFPLDVDAVRQLAAILDETGLTEIEVESDEQRIRVARKPATQEAVVAAPAAPAAVPVAAPVTASNVPNNAVSSPMVGTVYVSPEPGAAPFVRAGDTVHEGQTILIIEAMKVMNTIPAPRGGTVRDVFISDGQPVEFGEPLLVIE
jgi:acetyl-CoA carboxylase biotin carboxyl carrier protein